MWYPKQKSKFFHVNLFMLIYSTVNVEVVIGRFGVINYSIKSYYETYQRCCMSRLFQFFCRDWLVDMMEHFPIPSWLWEKRDPRMDGLPLLNSPVPTALICMCYVFIVKVAGPRFMQNREPYNIRTFLVIYNALQVALSAYIVYWVSVNRSYTYVQQAFSVLFL